MWLAFVLSQELDHKVDAELCELPYCKTTARLRARLVEAPERFAQSMDKLAERVKAALPALVIDHEELGTALCARVRDELKAVAEPPAAVEVEAQAEAEAKPEIEMEGAAAPPSEEDAGATPDTVFARHEEAQRASLLAEGQRLLRSFQQQHRDKVGLDGRALGECWAVGLVPKVEKARGKPRGRHVKAKLARGEGALDDQPTEEELYDAEVAAERAEGDSGGDMSADEEEETAALPSAGGAAHAGRAVGAKRRLGATLGLRPAFACTLCNGKPVLSKVAMASHRQGPKSCVRDKACRARVDGAAAPLDGFVGLAPAPVQPPPSSPSMGTKAPVRARSHVTGGRGGTGSVCRRRTGCDDRSCLNILKLLHWLS